MTGPDGDAVDKAALGMEIATPTLVGKRRVIEDRVAGQLTPERLGHVLRQAAIGEPRDYLTLAMEMEERYLHYASQLQTRYLAIDGIDPSVVVPDGVPAAIGDFVHELVDDPEFEGMCASISDGIGKGFAVAEIVWDYVGKRLRPVRYIWRDQRFFRFDKLTQSELRLEIDGSFEGVELPPAKFVRHVPRIRAGIPARGGLARPAAWAFMVQSFTLQDWAGFSETYGIPLRLGKYPVNASDKDKRAMLDGLRMFANDGAAIVPTGSEIEVFKVEGSHGTAVFGGLLDYVDAQISKLVVGQTMTADNGSSEAQAKVHNEVRQDIVKADARQRARTVNRDVIATAVALNFGPQDRYPQVLWPVAEPEDVAGLADSVAKLVPLGLKVSQTELRAKLGLGEPESDADLLGTRAPDTDTVDRPPTELPAGGKVKPATLSGHVAGCRCGGCRTATLAAEAAGTGIEDVDALVATLDAEWEALAEPLLGPVLAAIEDATSYDEALAAIEASGPDGTALADRLAVLMAIGRGIGDVKD